MRVSVCVCVHFSLGVYGIVESFMIFVLKHSYASDRIYGYKCIGVVEFLM